LCAEKRFVDGDRKAGRPTSAGGDIVVPAGEVGEAWFEGWMDDFGDRENQKLSIRSKPTCARDNRSMIVQDMRKGQRMQTRGKSIPWPSWLLYSSVS
jgi:hypothetical protein